jgi:hypothetical protein
MLKKLAALFQESGDSFQGQEPGEKVVMILRRHYFTILYPLSFILLLAFIPLAVQAAFETEIAMRNLGSFLSLASALWYLFLWLTAFYIITLYALNIVIITDRRLIENEQHAFFHRKVSELHLYRVQDIAVRTHGLIETLFSFGDVAVQSAASEREFIFRRVPHPEIAKDAIMKHVNNHRTNLKLS